MVSFSACVSFNLVTTRGSWIQNTLAPPCGSRWRCHGRVRLVLIFFLLIPFLFKQWWSGSGGPGRSQRVTTPHCSCGTTQTSRAWGAPPTDSVLESELDTPQSQVKGGWLLLVCHFLDALQTFSLYFFRILNLNVFLVAKLYYWNTPILQPTGCPLSFSWTCGFTRSTIGIHRTRANLVYCWSHLGIQNSHWCI